MRWLSGTVLALSQVANGLFNAFALRTKRRQEVLHAMSFPFPPSSPAPRVQHDYQEVRISQRFRLRLFRIVHTKRLTFFSGVGPELTDASDVGFGTVDRAEETGGEAWPAPGRLASQARPTFSQAGGDRRGLYIGADDRT
jgi:hypothetical protein